MSDKPSSPADADTGPAAFAQQRVSAAEQGFGPEIYQLVLHDIITRSEFGTRKYGHPLRATASVDFLTNLYQEMLDALIYVRAEIERRNTETVKADDGAVLAASWNNPGSTVTPM